MFFTYLRRELRRRMRQGIFIALGLAVGVGLVITVSSASAGVSQAESAVLHALYGVGTDITVTKPPVAGAEGGPIRFRGPGGPGRPKSGAKIHIDVLRNFGLGSLDESSVAAIAGARGVGAASGGLTLTDTLISGTIPTFGAGGPFSGAGGAGAQSGGTNRGSLTPTSFTVDGVDLSHGALGPLSSGRLVKGRTFSSADARGDVAVVDSNYAAQKKISVGSTITVAKHKFAVVGIVAAPQGDNPPDVYIPLARAQSLTTPAMTGKVNTIYVAATSASQIGAVSAEIRKMLPSATVTNSSDLASEVTGSLSSAASLAHNLGRWLAVAVLAAAFIVASLLTMSAVSRRVREFGTLKALGWRSRRVIGQVLGESLGLGLIGGAAGVGLGYAGAALISSLALPVSASVGLPPGSAAPGGPQGSGGPGGGGFAPGAFGAFRRLAADAGHTVTLHLSAPVTAGAVAAAVALAIAGGLIAGSFGGWRAARLRPAAALARAD